MDKSGNFDWRPYLEKLPQKATYKPSIGLRWEYDIIGNFLPIIPFKMKVHTSAGIENWFRLMLIREEDIVAEEDIKISEIDEITWFDISNLCNIEPRAKSRFGHIIRHILGDKNLEIIDYQFIEKVGWNKISIVSEDTYCYNTGETLILPNDIDPKIAERIKFKKSDYILKSDRKYPEEVAAAGMIKALSIYRRVSVFVLAFTIAALLKSVLRECGIIPKFVLYICGKRDSLKTAYTKLLSPISYINDDFSKLLKQFNSTNYIVSNLTNDYPDFPLILDNVYESEDSNIKRRITGIFEETVQTLGDDTEKSNARATYKPSSSLIVTGEFDGIGNPSTVARYLTILFANDAIKSSEKQSLLHKLQKEPSLISSFYVFFLQWIADNLEVIKASIKDLFTNFRAVQNTLNISEKLKERYFILRTCYIIFLKYCTEKNIFVNEQAVQLRKEFEEQLLEICHRHNNTIIAKESKENAVADDFFELIKFWHHDNQFKTAKNENDKNLKDKEALIYDGFLCLRSEALMAKINKLFPSVKCKDVTAQLVAKNVLKADAGRNTGKIKGIRFLKIPLKKL